MKTKHLSNGFVINKYDNGHCDIVYTESFDNTMNFTIEYDIDDLIAISFGSELKSANIVDTVEDLLKDYVLEHFNKYDIQEIGSNIYDVIKEKAYDILCDCINDLYESFNYNEKDYDVNNYAEEYYEDIDVYCIDEVIEDILNSPATFEEKLADVGMSIKDFL